MIRGEMMRRMSSEEFMEWLAYDRIQPLPDGYWEAALIASTIANSMSKKKHKLESFLPRKAKVVEKPQTGPQMLSIVESVVKNVTRQKTLGGK